VLAPLDGSESNTNESDIPERVWAVEGRNRISKHIAHRLVAKGEAVANLSERTWRSSRRGSRAPNGRGV
jgi:hypothetical protein